MINFIIVSSKSGDWEALYANGKLVAEGHSLSVRDVLDCINAMLPNTVKIIEIDDEVAEVGMPICLNDLSSAAW